MHVGKACAEDWQATEKRFGFATDKLACLRLPQSSGCKRLENLTGKGRRQNTIACPTEQHSRNQTLPVIPSRPIENRPQAASLPYNSSRAAKILGSSSTEQQSRNQRSRAVRLTIGRRLPTCPTILCRLQRFSGLVVHECNWHTISWQALTAGIGHHRHRLHFDQPFRTDQPANHHERAYRRRRYVHQAIADLPDHRQVNR
jgi:hypothetical protein